MRCNRKSAAGVVRSGLTLLEIVVCIAIVLVLLAIFLPTASVSRDAARRTHCLNNQKNLALAQLNCATNRSGQLAAQGYYPVNSAVEADRVTVFEGRSWVVELLPYLDRADLSDNWNLNAAWDHDTAVGPGGKTTNRSLAETYIQVLTCPQDKSAFSQPGGLSYVENCGIGDRNFAAFSRRDSSDGSDLGHACEIEPFDWDGDGILPPDDRNDIAVTCDIGVFWPQFGFFDSDHDGAARRSLGSANLNEVYDGTSNTILMTENVNAGMSGTRKFNSWANPQLANCGFLLPVKASAVGPSTLGTGVEMLIDESAGNPRINALNDGRHEGRAPFPNSNHPGLIVVSFCDGRVSTLSEDIDLSVYARLLTAGGSQPREIPNFTPESSLSETDF